MIVHYALCVTSCDRHDLLHIALDSFIATCGNQPRCTFIVEDSPAPMPTWLRDNINYYQSRLGKITWLGNESRRGQVYSIDRLIAALPREIERVFWLEDDWQFDSGGYVTPGLEILDRYPKICQVVFRNDWAHTLVDVPPFEGFKVAMPGWKGGWGGWTWNPCMTRKEDLLRFGTYASQAGYVTGLTHELALSKKYLGAGYRIAALPFHCHHIGGSRSRSGDAIPVSKILIALPVCHKFEYGRWEGDHENKGDAKDYHFSGDNDRISAIRDTWLRDVKQFPNVTYKLFYGAPHERPALDDEVFLNCGDTYADLPAKTIAICKYAVEHGYDLLVKLDDDTGVYTDRLVHEGLSLMGDYAGYLNGRVCTGGTGYWMTRRAFTIIAEKATATYHWAEDVSVSHFLFQHNIQGRHLDGHRTGRADHWFWKDGYDPSVSMDGITTFHAVRPSDMRAWHKSIQGGK